jgi:hypothetical protein
MVYMHVLNVAVKGTQFRSTGCGKLSQTRAAGLTGPTGRPNTGRASYWTRQKWLQGNWLPPRSGNRPLRLRLTGTGFIQFSLNKSYAARASDRVR